MQNDSFLKNPQIFLLGISIAAATIASSYILSGALVQIQKTKTEIIDVTGSADKKIISDYAVWRADLLKRDLTMASAHTALKSDLDQVRAYLLEKGVLESEITIPQVETIIFYRKNERGMDTNEIEGYQLSQKIVVSSNDVQKVMAISRIATDLIEQGIWINSQWPEFYYTKLGELKLEMLAKASENAKKRADGIASSTGNKISVLRKADMGVFQITSVHSNEVSDYGYNDTSSLEKKVTAIIHASFAIA